MDIVHWSKPAVMTVLLLSGCQLAPPTKVATVAGNTSSTKETSEITEIPTQPQIINDNSINVPPTNYVLERSGTIHAPVLSEISGLTVSNLSDDVLWTINDSGNAAELHALSTDGDVIQSFTTPLINRDWETMTGFVRNGDAFLLLADSGDNLTAHDSYQLHLFREPILTPGSADTTLTPVSSMHFRYPDGSHNCEAMAVSEPDSRIILITKRADEPGVYSLPLSLPPDNPGVTDSHNEEPVIADRLGTLTDIPQPVADRLLGNLSGVDLSQATGLEIDSSGSYAHLLTYRGIYQFQRESLIEDWGSTFARPATLIRRHNLAQAEALGLSQATGSVYFTSERLPAPLWRLRPR